MRGARSLARYRPTLRQLLGRSLVVGLVVGLCAAVVAGAAALSGVQWPMFYLLILPLTAAGVFVVLSEFGHHQGVDASTRGLTRVSGAVRGRSVAWGEVRDIRTERRGWRTVVVVAERTGAQWRLPAPYDGGWLWHDPEFEPKLFYLRNLWETYRTGSRVGPANPSGGLDPAP